MKQKPTRGRFQFALSLLIAYLCFAGLLWFFYFKNGHLKSGSYEDNIILIFGTIFAALAGFLAWTMDHRTRQLELEVKHKSAQVFQKNSETKQAEIASAAIYEAARLLFSDVHFGGLLEKVLDIVSKVVYIDEGSLMLFDSNHELYIAASRGMSDEIACGVHMRIGERVAGRVAQERRDYLIVDGIEKYPEFEGVEPNPRIQSSIVCPLICQNELLGVLSINRTQTKENFTIADMMNISIFSSQVAQAIRNAYLYRTLEDKVDQLEEANRKLKALQERIR